MTGDRFHESIGPYLDGELGADEARRIEAHLSECASCRALRDDLEAVSRTMRAIGRASLPPDLRAALLREGVAAQGGRRGRTRPRPWVLATLGSAALLVVIGLLANRGGSDGTLPRGGRGVPGAPPAGAPPAPPEPGAGPSASQAEDAAEETEATAGREAKEKDDRAAPGVAVVDRPPSPSTLPPAPDPRRATAGSIRQDAPSGPGRYAAKIVIDDTGSPSIGPLTPLSDTPDPIDTPRRLSPGEAATPGPRAMHYHGPGTTAVFLLRLDTSGRVVAADAVGARSVPAPTMRAIAAMLVGSVLTPHRDEDPSLIAVEIALPASE